MYLNNLFNLIANYNFKKINISFLILLIFLHCLIYIKYDLSVYNLTKIIVFHFIYILIPGFFFYSFLSQSNKDSFFKKFAFSFGVGIFFIIIQYFFFQYFQKLNYITYTNPILSLIFLFFFYKKSMFNINLLNLNTISSVSFFSILFLILIFLFGSIFASPPLAVNKVASFMQDKLFMVGLMDGLIRGYPPPDVKTAGVSLNYYAYYSPIYLSIISYVSKISNFEMYFYLSQYFKIIFFVSSLGYFSEYIFDKKREKNIFIFFAVFLSCASLFYNFFHNGGKFGNENLFHITVFPNGYMLAMTYIFLITPEIINSLKYKSFSLKNLFLFSLFFIMICGSKAANAIFIVGTINLFLIFLVFLKARISFQFITLAITTNIIFLIFYFFIYYNSQKYYSFEFHIGHLFRSYHPNEDLLEVIFYNIISLFFIPFHQILFHPLSIIIYFHLFINVSANKNKTFNLNFLKKFLIKFINLNRNNNYHELFVFCAILTSFITYLFWFKFGGSSYFMMIGTYFFSVFSLKLLFDKKFYFNKKLKNIFFIFILISLLGTFFYSTKYLVKGTLVFMNSFVNKKECKNISYQDKKSLNKFDKYYPKDNCPDWDRLTYNEYLGLIWINKNTHRDSIILSDRLYYDKSNIAQNARFFYYSVFSKRIIYLEGFYYWTDYSIINKRKNLIEAFYDNNIPMENKINFLKKNKIDIIIVSNFLNKDLNLEHDNLSLVFNNRDIRIYKTKENI